MRTLKTLAFAAVTTTLAMSSAFAAAPGGQWVGGEAGFVPAPAQSERTRAAVQQELRDFKRSPTSHDGVAFVGGNAGYQQVPVAQHPKHHGGAQLTDAGRQAAPAAGATQTR